jgi:cell division protein FtsB
VNRQIQHRPQREEQLRAQEAAELKRQNRVLKRQVSRLTKENERLLAMPEPEAEPTDSLDIPFPFSRCESCNSMKVRDISLPIGILRVCEDCGARKKI